MPENNSKGISQRFDYELNEISYKLEQLEKGRIMELTGAKCDGFLATNIQELKKMLNELLTKIDRGEQSFSESIEKWFK